MRFSRFICYSSLIVLISFLDCFTRSVLVTGGAGFIGSHVSQALLKRGDRVIIVDNLNDYYSPILKQKNLACVKDTAAQYENNNLRIEYFDINNRDLLEKLFIEEKPDVICHLAAQAGVRYSIENPMEYVKTNIQGTLNILELIRKFGINNFVFASSSSVYGDSEEAPFHEEQKADRPCSPYAATKRSCELICYTYHHLYHIPTTCLRFFTVYGPRGRPDMAPYKFIDAAHNGKEICQYGDGSSLRDYTYIDDIVDGVIRAIDRPHDFEIINLGNGNTISLRDFIKTIEEIVGKKMKIRVIEDQKGDVPLTNADISKAQRLLGYQPKVSVKEGMERIYRWYLQP